LIRIFGATYFFAGRSSEDKSFYAADCAKSVRSTLATHKAFTGVTEEAGNNNVFHAAEIDPSGLPAMVLMVQKEDYNAVLEDDDHIKAMRIMHEFLKQKVRPMEDLKKGFQKLRELD